MARSPQIASLAPKIPALAATPRDPSSADALFQSAKDAFDRGDLATACPRFAESQRLDPAPGTVLNLGACEEKRGHVAAAWQAFREARDALPAGDFRIAYADERIAALQPRVPRLVLRLASPPAGTRVFRDDVELGPSAASVPLPVEPGPHRFLVRTPGREDRAFDVTLREGETRETDLGAGPVAQVARPAEPPMQSAPMGPGQASRPTLGYVAAGVGVAGVITGVIAAVVVGNAASTYKATCKNGECTPEGLDAASRGKTFSIVSPVGFGVGAVGLAAGAYLLFVKPRGTQTATTVVPVPLASGAGLSLTRTF